MGRPLVGKSNQASSQQRVPKNKWIRQQTTQLIDVPIREVPGPIAGNVGGLTTTILSKRKPAQQEILPQTIDSPRKKSYKTPIQASVAISDTGIVSVQIQKEHCKLIGDSCGVMPGEVVRAVLADNDDRRGKAPMAAELADPVEDYGSDWEDDARFEPDSEDELEMEVDDI